MKLRTSVPSITATVALACTTALAHPGHGGTEDPRGLLHYLEFHGLGIALLSPIVVAAAAALQRAWHSRRRNGARPH